MSQMLPNPARGIERRVLGSLQHGWLDALELDYSDFVFAPHGAIYEACQRVHVSEVALSPGAVWAMLAARESWLDGRNEWHGDEERAGALVLFGGRAYLDGLPRGATRADVVVIKRARLLRDQQVEREIFRARWNAWRKQ